MCSRYSADPVRRDLHTLKNLSDFIESLECVNLKYFHTFISPHNSFNLLIKSSSILIMTILPNHGGAIPPHATDVNDVLCGNGKRYRKTQGNDMYHRLVRAFVDEYAKQVRRKSKTSITKSIVEAIRMAQPPGRFLLMSKDGCFYEIGDERACGKTSQLLRDIVHENKRKDKNRESHATNNPTFIYPACCAEGPSSSQCQVQGYQEQVHFDFTCQNTCLKDLK